MTDQTATTNPSTSSMNDADTTVVAVEKDADSVTTVQADPKTGQVTTETTTTQSDEPVPFYKTVKRSFKDVTVKPGVKTDEFCEAVDAVVDFFDLFQNRAFKVVQDDLSSKNAKVRERLALYPETSDTLEDILRNEKQSGDRFASGQLTWLLRALRFTSLGLRENLQNEQEELSVSMSRAYDNSLKQFHGWLVRPIFKLAMNACPWRAKFYPSLGTPTDVVMAELDDWLAGLERILQQMADFYKTDDYGSIGM